MTFFPFFFFVSWLFYLHEIHGSPEIAVFKVGNEAITRFDPLVSTAMDLPGETYNFGLVGQHYVW